MEDTDWRQLMRRPPAEEDTESLDRRYEARLASPGLLRESLRHGHPQVLEASAVDSTRTCSVCGAGPASDWDAVAELVYRCTAGHRMDQDENAARNLLSTHTGGEVVAE